MAEDDVVASADEGGVDDEYYDELPDDLNAADFVGPYLFPNNSKRRIPGVLYPVSYTHLTLPTIYPV